MSDARIKSGLTLHRFTGCSRLGAKEENRATEARTGPQISTHRQANEEGAGGGFGEGYEAFQC